mgnify:CR=1 FL=1
MTTKVDQEIKELEEILSSLKESRATVVASARESEQRKSSKFA